MTLHLPPGLLAEMLDHCREQHPREACGILIGHDDQPLRLRRMHNLADDPTSRFAFDPDEQLEVYRALDELGLDPVAIYHSHTSSAAVPSRTDVACAREEQAHYVIVSTRHETPAAGHDHEIRSYRLADGQLIEEPVEVMAPCG